MPKMFDINKWCENKRTAAPSNVTYSKVVTGGNNPTITKAMRYSQYIRSTRRSNVKYGDYINP